MVLLCVGSFDSSDFESKTPQEWLDSGYCVTTGGEEQEGPLAYTLFLLNGEWKWRPCVVQVRCSTAAPVIAPPGRTSRAADCPRGSQGYDGEVLKYRVRFIDPAVLPNEPPTIAAFVGEGFGLRAAPPALHFTHSDHARASTGSSAAATGGICVDEKWVNRLNLRFAVEKGWLFDARREAALQRREKAKQQLRQVSRRTPCRRLLRRVTPSHGVIAVAALLVDGAVLTGTCITWTACRATSPSSHPCPPSPRSTCYGALFLAALRPRWWNARMPASRVC